MTEENKIDILYKDTEKSLNFNFLKELKKAEVFLKENSWFFSKTRRVKFEDTIFWRDLENRGDIQDTCKIKIMIQKTSAQILIFYNNSPKVNVVMHYEINGVNIKKGKVEAWESPKMDFLFFAYS